MKLHRQELIKTMLTIISIGGSAAFLVIVITFSALWWSLSQPKGRLNCHSFGSYSAMFDAFIHGSPQLDGNKDGKPCVDMYPTGVDY